MAVNCLLSAVNCTVCLFFDALILGLLQGFTEYIPISSSGHLLIAHKILGTGENTLAFDVALHVGTLLALVLFFRKDLWNFSS
jgi:undecaprenyl-diphosphatase